MLAAKHDVATIEHDLKWEIEVVLAFHDEDERRPLQRCSPTSVTSAC
jgi:hypothetical protein